VGTDLPRLPLLTPWHRLAAEDDRLVLEYGGEAVCFEGRAAQALLPALLPLLDGTRTIDEIVLVLGEPARPAVEHALELLADHRLLVAGPPLEPSLPLPLATSALFDKAVGNAGVSPREALRDLQARSVAVVGTSPAAAEIARALRLSGIGDLTLRAWGETGSLPELAVAAPDPAELPRLAAWNEHALETRTPWLQVLPYNGRFSAIGPLFVPGETCCYECYRGRRASNVDYPDEFWALERSERGVQDPPALTTAIAGLASMLALRWLSFRDPWAAGVMSALELDESLRLAPHIVYRVPRCPACSGAARLAAPLPWAEAS
jgi:bacteriocin biosynthesis cyclodehydratase domain-containing protein